mmetsp:Transcript_23278/g.58332  ORF Transcript_23278/g.58332 Transcript_23278/m.58332 type:complete len:204 (-) Transcript_23278:657-1268(-)
MTSELAEVAFSVFLLALSALAFFSIASSISTFFSSSHSLLSTTKLLTRSARVRESFLTSPLPSTVGDDFFCTLSHSDSTTCPYCSPLLIAAIIRAHDAFHRSIHALAISSVHSSPHDCSSTVSSTCPMIGMWCGLAPYLTCRDPSQVICSIILFSSSTKDTRVLTISTNFIAMTGRGRANIDLSEGASSKRVSKSMPPRSSSV